MSNEKVFDFLERSLGKIHSASIELETPDGNRQFNPSFTSLVTFLTEARYSKIQNGSIFEENIPQIQRYEGRLEVRVGNHEKGGAMFSDNFKLPLSLDEASSWLEIWKIANPVLWGAVGEYEAKISQGMGLPLEKKKEFFDYFSKEKPIRFEEANINLEKNLGLEDIFQRVTRDLSHPDILDIVASPSVIKNCRFYVNSEGSHIFTNDVGYLIFMGVQTICDDGFLLPHNYRFLTKDPTKIPTYDSLMEIGEQLIKEVLEMSKAPIQDNGAFPAILCPENHGVIWHEVVGHSLEGHRMQEDEFGDVISIFKNLVGKKIAPDFLSLYDDPTQEGMWGTYLFDDEGVPAQKVVLVENGILRNYLHSRESAGYFKTQSNGHARSEALEDPVARMSNLIVDSSNEVPYEELKENLIKMCRNEGEEYGLILKSSDGGLTLPEESFYNTVPVHVFRIFPDGKEERVRGIYVVGTPHQTLQNIVQTSDRYDSFSGFCGAESGMVYSEEKAPDALVKSLEVNRLPESTYYRLLEPILPK